MKRFTETTKWSDPWFRRLTPSQKCLWGYILDNCDAAGVLDLDLEHASFHIGTTLTELDLAAFDGRIERLKDGKILISGFIEFQFGTLSEDCKPHAQVFKALDRHGLKYQKSRVSKGYGKGMDTLKDKDKDKEKDKDGCMIEAIWSAYPLKVGKKKACGIIENLLKTGRTDLLEKVKAYAAAVETWPAGDKQYIPHPATWFNRGSYDDDPATWQRKASKPATPKPDRINFKTDDYTGFST